MSQTTPTPPNAGHWRLEFITPQTADTYLKTQEGHPNRHPRKARITQIARAITDGRYRLTHQGIAFDDNAVLRDGQHRLYAIIEAGLPVWMWVYRGLLSEAKLVIDTHIPRREADALLIEGFEGIHHRHVAVAKRMMVGPINHSGCALDRDDLRKFMNEHWEAITFSCDHLNTSKGIGSASVCACISRAYYTADRDRLIEFCSTLKEGVTASTDNFAAIKLRQFVTETKISGGDAARTILYRKVQSALRAFLERRSLTKLYEVSDDLFPLKMNREVMRFDALRGAS